MLSISNMVSELNDLFIVYSNENTRIELVTKYLDDFDKSINVDGLFDLLPKYIDVYCVSRIFAQKLSIYSTDISNIFKIADLLRLKKIEVLYFPNEHLYSFSKDINGANEWYLDIKIFIMKMKKFNKYRSDVHLYPEEFVN